MDQLNNVQIKPSSHPFLVDSTLRDGEQSVGVCFSLKDKQEILQNLIGIGIKEIEVGIPAMGLEEQKEIGILVDLGIEAKVRIITWARGCGEDIEACHRTGAEAIHIALPTSQLQMKCIRQKRSSVLRRLAHCLSVATKKFKTVSVGAQDATRADPVFLFEYIDQAINGGASRIRISDTVGIAHPFSIYEMIAKFKSRYPKIECEFHGHDDFGMAAANSLMALQAGADCVSVTVLGLGERAGNAALEQVVMAAKYLSQIDLGVDTSKIMSLCSIVSRASGCAIPSSQPIVGSTVLCHESGIHTQGQLVQPLGFQPFYPQEVGHLHSGFHFGKHSGRAAIRAVLSRRYTDLSAEWVDRVTERIKAMSRIKKRCYTEEELLILASQTS